MSLAGRRTFVGFGLGAIQAGLFLYEAQQSGNFGRLVTSEVMPATLREARQNGGFLTVNVAHPDRIEAAQVGPIEVLDPFHGSDREKLEAAVAEAEEIATAVPGVTFYCNTPGPEALARILAAGLRRKRAENGPRAVIYAAENHNHAAELLSEAVLAGIPKTEQKPVLRQVRFLNTVIGKMSGVVADPQEIRALELAPMTPTSSRAFLVESFNRILVSRISFTRPHFQRGITTFIEKDDLLPFEEAKLFGHNATHALGAYLGAVLGVQRIAGLPRVPGMLEFLRRAFIEESGAALIHRYQGIDPLFTPRGYTEYADDLLARMCSPFLADTVERVGRDVERKLGWDDRLVGTLRLGLAEGVRPARYALGTAAALACWDPAFLTQPLDPAERLGTLWGRDDPAAEVVDLIRGGLARLRRWKAGCPDDPRALLDVT